MLAWWSISRTCWSALALEPWVGVPLGALLRPLGARMERTSRRWFDVDPLLVHVERDPAIVRSGEPDWMSFSLYCRDVMSLPTPPKDRIEWLAWGRRNGCFDALVSQLRVTIQARTEAAVVVDSVGVTQDRRPVNDGFILTRPAAGRPDIDPRRFVVDLDWGDRSPVTTFYGPGGAPSELPSVKLAAGDIEQFEIWADARSGWHEWYLELRMLVEGRRVIRKITDQGGAPFVTVGAEGLTHLASSDDGVWRPWPPSEPVI